MSKSEVSVQVTPNELAQWLVDLQVEFPGKVVMEFEALEARDKRLGLLVTLSHTRAGAGDNSRARTEAVMAWPCSTHKSVLAVAVALCGVVERQLQAQRALAEQTAG